MTLSGSVTLFYSPPGDLFNSNQPKERNKQYNCEFYLCLVSLTMLHAYNVFLQLEEISSNNQYLLSIYVLVMILNAVPISAYLIFIRTLIRKYYYYTPFH